MSDRSTRTVVDQSDSTPRAQFNAAMGKAGLRPSTRAFYLREFERFNRALLGNAISQATVSMAKRHLAEMTRSGKSRSVVANAQAALRFWFERVQGQEWNPASPLRRRMLDDMALHSFSPRTQQSYVRSVLGLAKYYGRSPDQLTEEDVRRYFVHLTCERKLARPTVTIALCGIKFLWEKTLKRDWSLTGVPVPKREKKVPVVLTVDEVATILSEVTVIRHKAALTLAYCCGLRLQEVCHVRNDDILRDRGLVHVRGKGAKERYVPLPECVLPLLEACWRSHHNPVWLFPWVGRGASKALTSESPVPKGSVQQAFRKALLASGVNRKVSVHSLRHAYATHLLEAGVPMKQIQQWLGHASPSTTNIYAHLTASSTQASTGTLEEVMQRLFPKT